MTKIKWTDETLNWAFGCTKMSDGCTNCYAERMHNRLTSMHYAMDCWECKHSEYNDTMGEMYCQHPKSNPDDCPKPTPPKGYEKAFDKGVTYHLDILEKKLKEYDKTVGYYYRENLFKEYLGETAFGTKVFVKYEKDKVKFKTKTEIKEYIKKYIPKDIHTFDETCCVPIKKRSRIFVNSMSDTFHKDIPLETIKKAFDMMAKYPQHQFQILTKRYDRLVKYIRYYDIPSNIHAGVSICNKTDFQLFFNEYFNNNNLETIIKTHQNSPTLFVSFEPLLEDVTEWFNENNGANNYRFMFYFPFMFNWVIVGGESGPGARPMNTEWVRSIRDLCTHHKIPFFFKQYSQFKNKDYKNAILDGRKWEQYCE